MSKTIFAATVSVNTIWANEKSGEIIIPCTVGAQSVELNAVVGYNKVAKLQDGKAVTTDKPRTVKIPLANMKFLGNTSDSIESGKKLAILITGVKDGKGDFAALAADGKCLVVAAGGDIQKLHNTAFAALSDPKMLAELESVEVAEAVAAEPSPF